MAKADPGTPKRGDAPPELLAVIDVGTTALRMAIAQSDAAAVIRPLEAVTQAVDLGKDTFTRGAISHATTEQCVAALRSFRRLLDEYGITRPDRIHAVATSAVREAANRQAFLDRLFIATGIEVEVIDEPEVNRYTYLSVLPLLETVPMLRKRNLMLVEVGAGSTEFLRLREGQVVASQSHRLGALRMREMLEEFRAPTARHRAILEEHILRTVERVSAEMGTRMGMPVLALGGDARFAARQILKHPDDEHVWRVPLEAFARLTDRILRLSVDEIVDRYALPYPEAESLGPALLTCMLLARAFRRKVVKVADVTLREGLLAELASQDYWLEKTREQVIHSALDLGRKYGFDEEHACNVARHSRLLLDAIEDAHGLSARHKLILTVAALLHEIGQFVSTRNHHKHSMYLIRNGSLFGLGARDLDLAAQVARYHRRAVPKPSHEEYMNLNREDRIAVAKMAAVLRVADALNRGTGRFIREMTIRRERDRMVITARNVGDVTLEQMALDEKATLFEQVYGLGVVLRTEQGGER
jgi:exopolyphosphatase / guanosine-5'-triphosphate,3'-diphosphate pyrophosphatase